jgi:uncharacterized membrane protein (UPF0127 family)
MFLAPLLRDSGRTWGLENLDTGASLSSRVETAFESATRRRGLLGRVRLDDTALVIAPCGAVHTFFMRFAIDVLFVDRQGAVLKVCHDVRPWRIAAAWRGFAAIEVAAGAARRAGIRAGHRLSLTTIG